MMQRHTVYKEQEDAMRNIENEIRKVLWSEDTGMPDVAMMGFAPLNADEFD